jgi:hypothetical protein
MQVNTVQTKIDGDLFGKLRNCEYLCNQKSIGYGCDAEGSEGGPANWEIDEQQEKFIEQWAKAANLWEDDSEHILTAEFGPKYLKLPNNLPQSSNFTIFLCTFASC